MAPLGIKTWWLHLLSVSLKYILNRLSTLWPQSWVKKELYDFDDDDDDEVQVT